MGCYPVNVVVFPLAAAPVVYTALDLSAHVGAAEVNVRIRVRSVTSAGGGGVQFISTKPGPGPGADPHPEDWYDSGLNAVDGANNAWLSAVDKIQVVEVPTDSLGVIRWKAVYAGTAELTLVDYSELTGAPWRQFLAGAPPAVWTDESLVVDGVVDHLVYLKCQINFGGGFYYRTRPDGIVTDTAYGTSYYVGGAASNVSCGNIIRAEAGIIEQQGNGTFDVWNATFRDIVPVAKAAAGNPVWNAAAPVGAFGDVDCSAHYAGRAHFLLAVEGDNGGAAGGINARMGPPDDPLIAQYDFSVASTPPGLVGARFYCGASRIAYQWVESNNLGHIAFEAASNRTVRIDVIGYEPIITNVGPTATWTTPAGPNILPGAALSGTTTDPDDGIDVSKTTLTLTPPVGPAELAVSGGVVQAGFTGTCTAAGVSVTKDGGMAPGAHTAVLHCEDLSGATHDANGNWTVAWTTPPTVVYPHPTDYTAEVDQIRFTITDTYGLDPATLSLAAVVTGSGSKVTTPAIAAGAVLAGWEATITPDDYDGAVPRRLDVAITGWPRALVAAFAAVYRRVQMAVGITSSTGVEL